MFMQTTFFNYQLSTISSAHRADVNAEEVESNNHEQTYSDGCEDAADDLDSLEPDQVAPAQGLQSRPDAVVEVEPESHEPNDVEQAVDDARPTVGEEGFDDSAAVLWVEDGGVNACQFGELHLEPEVVEVQQQEADNDDTQHEHVLRLPVHAFLTCLDGVAVIAACAVVEDGEVERVAEVHEHTQCQHAGTDECVPVGT